eukprot:TRINITY_DN24671_c0_g1_i1.p1 TRINITY_DN24671_c0_g1~~TRINITY_DN24671_c0_g1_i1.p1  ORF type:complete len:638 (+),score=279.02 TRINITY_DN24671_c0_g1_i1:100-1914(+)
MYGGMADEGDGFDDEQDGFGFEEYAMDDTLDAITRLERYHTSDFSLQRLVLVRELADTARDAGYGPTIQRMLPLLGNFVADSEPAVRQCFVEQLPPLANFLIAGGETGYQELINTFLPFTFELLVDKNVQVGVSAVRTLIQLVELVREEQVEPQLLSVVVTLSHDERAEDYRIVAAQLFNELAKKFGPDRCRETVVKELVTLSSDASFSVRRTVGSNMGNIMSVVGTEVACAQLLPIYLTLCGDDIWGVRKACAEHICEVSRSVTADIRKGRLSDAFMKLADDASRWVKVSAMQNLGGFIHTFAREDVPAQLIKLFAQMAPQGDGAESDFSEYCAFSFPAVMEATGKERWPELQDAYVSLVKDVEWKVRRTLSFSLHEIGAILGSDESEKILTQAFDLFLRDLDEVKVGCLTHVASFMRCLGDTAREKHLRTLANLPQETDNWRLRELIARNLGDIATIVPPKVCRDVLQSAMIRLSEDPVADVRTAAHPSCAKMFKALHAGEQHQDLFAWITGLVHGQAHFQRRQMFIQIVVHCALSGCVIDEFVDELEKIAEDKVPNVRLLLAEMLTKVCEADAATPRLKSLRARLQDDPDKDVQFFSSAAA